MKKSVKLIALGACILPAVAAVAANLSPVIKQRQANFSLMGKSMKAIGDELKSPNTSMATIRTNAKTLHGAAKKVSGPFPEGIRPRVRRRNRCFAYYLDPTIKPLRLRRQNWSMQLMP